jgi:PilZ domain
MDDEHRIAPRQRVLKGASIQFGGAAIDCTVRNLSETGAALEVATSLGIPTEFTLVMATARHPCRVVWRKEKRIGITFEKDGG